MKRVKSFNQVRLNSSSLNLNFISILVETGAKKGLKEASINKINKDYREKEVFHYSEPKTPQRNSLPKPTSQKLLTTFSLHILLLLTSLIIGSHNVNTPTSLVIDSHNVNTNSSTSPVSKFSLPITFLIFFVSFWYTPSKSWAFDLAH